MLTIIVESREPASDPFEDRYADVSTFRTRFWRAGRAGPAVILLAGIGCSVLEWKKNIAALADPAPRLRLRHARPRPDR